MPLTYLARQTGLKSDVGRMARDHWAAKRNLCLQTSPPHLSHQCAREKQIIQLKLYAGLKEELTHVKYKHGIAKAMVWLYF
jgi:hypothetical protein